MAKFDFEHIKDSVHAIELLENILSMKRHPTYDEQVKVQILVEHLYRVMPNWALKLILLDHGWETYYGEVVNECGRYYFKEVMGRHGFWDEAFYEEI